MLMAGDASEYSKEKKLALILGVFTAIVIVAIIAKYLMSSSDFVGGFIFMFISAYAPFLLFADVYGAPILFILFVAALCITAYGGIPLFYLLFKSYRIKHGVPFAVWTTMLILMLLAILGVSVF